MKMRISPVPLTLMSLHSQSRLSPVMGSNDTCRTPSHYNETVGVKLKGVDSQLDTDQCLLFLLGKDKRHGHAPRMHLCSTFHKVMD